MVYEEEKWYEPESLEIVKEANERALEIISQLRLAIINTAMYDNANYVKFGMSGDPQSAAFKKMFNMKLEIVEYLEKETKLVFSDRRHLHQERRRAIKDKMINELMEFLNAHLIGRTPSPHLLNKAASVVEKILSHSDKILDDGIRINGKILDRPKNIFESPVYRIKHESLY